MPFGGADGLRLDRQANAPAEDTARMRDHRVCKHGFRFPGSCASTLMACTRGPMGGGGQVGGLQARLVTLFLIHCSDARTENS